MPRAPSTATLLVLAAAMAPLAGASAARAADPAAPALGKAGDFTLAAPEVEEDIASGWYLRADAGYVFPSGTGIAAAGVLPAVPASFDLGTAGWSLGAGIGYRFTSWLRTDLSISTMALGDTRGALGVGSASAAVGMATLYWDIGTFFGVTPYVGAGVGYGVTSLDNPAGTINGSGLAWSLTAGAAYKVNNQISLDFSYRYVDLGAPRLQGGAQVVMLDGVSAQEVRFGVRYALK